MNLFEILILSVTVFFTAAILMLLLLAIYMAMVKIVELAKKRTRRAERNQGDYYYYKAPFFIDVLSSVDAQSIPRSRAQLDVRLSPRQPQLEYVYFLFV